MDALDIGGDLVMSIRGTCEKSDSIRDSWQSWKTTQSCLVMSPVNQTWITRRPYCRWCTWVPLVRRFSALALGYDVLPTDEASLQTRTVAVHLVVTLINAPTPGGAYDAGAPVAESAG